MELKNFDNTAFDFDAFITSKMHVIKQEGRYRHFIEIEKKSNSFPLFTYRKDGVSKSATNWCSNDYLAMSTRQEIIIPTVNTIETRGIGSGGTRNISGSTIEHTELESTLAAWHNKEKALVFNSAYQANLTTLGTIGRAIPELIFISDEENHASLIEGIRSTRCQKQLFKHNDIAHLESILKSIPYSVPKIVVFESVYSISGTVAPVLEIIELSKKYGALSYIDEVHAVGLYGATGAGYIESAGLQSQVDFINGTLSKAIGCFGGYIAASAVWIDFIRSHANGFIFTTSLPPAICKAATTSIQFIQQNHSLRTTFFQNVQLVRTYLEQAHIEFNGKQSHITNIKIGNAITCKQIADYLLYECGIYVQPINYPTVSKGNECLRITITPKHGLKDIYHLVKHLQILSSDTIRITGRSSFLSKEQMNIVDQKISTLFPWIKTQHIYTESRGDQLQNIPLHTQEGTDFFTDAVVQNLKENKADIAVHSLKDMSSTHFFSDHNFAVVDRDEVRDLAIFNENILDLIKNNKKIRIGTCSFRRESLALDFLKNALPQLSDSIQLEAVPIRGNIDSRLKKLSSGAYDAIILAFAGIHRMLKSSSVQNEIESVLATKKMMVLPLFECTPAPCQGAIAAEALPNNHIASYIVDKINDKFLYTICKEEKAIGLKYGSGCIQKFGVTSIHIDSKTFYYANGTDENGQVVDDWFGLDSLPSPLRPEEILYSEEFGFKANRMYYPTQDKINDYTNIFVSHISAINQIDISQLKSKSFWTAGTATWKKLASLGLWVTGCADSLGFKSIQSMVESKLFHSKLESFLILTNNDSAVRWNEKNQPAVGTYDIQYKSNLIDKYKVTKAKFIFWSCFAHYDNVKDLVTKEVVHACLPGQTSNLLREQGLNPIVFPTLQSFQNWKKKYVQSYHIA